MHGPKETALAFDRACREARVPYAFVGGVAVMAWGQPRATADVDALVALQPDDVDHFVNCLRGEGLEAETEDLRAAFEDRSHVTVFDRAGPFHLDLVLVSTAQERREVADAQTVKLGNGEIRVPEAEQVVAFKVHYGSPQDIQDARSILVRQAGKLDLAKLRDLARELGVADELEGLLRELDNG